MSLSHKITVYLGREPNFEKEVILQDDGDGAYIKEWNVVDKEKPSDKELDTFEVEAQKLVDDNLIIENRKSEYPSLQECVHAILDNQLDALQAKRASVKLKYPKGG